MRTLKKKKKKKDVVLSYSYLWQRVTPHIIFYSILCF